jgi:hypothetical protein
MSQDTKELKLAVLIDADNVLYSNVKGMMEVAKYNTYNKAHLCRLDEAKCRRMENCFVRICNHTNQQYSQKNQIQR